ncbi:MAG: twin-arginine translocase TatA/TatE family subunit [Vicinamibacterales bacterium]
MFGSLGLPELFIILTIALIIFGPRKLPELGKSLGRSLSEFKKASHELRSTLDEEIRSEQRDGHRSAPVTGVAGQSDDAGRAPLSSTTMADAAVPQHGRA